MACIQQRKRADGSTSYRVLVRRKGYPPRYATFTRSADAKEWARRVEAGIAWRPRDARGKRGQRSVADLVRRYLEIVRRKRPQAYLKQKQQLGWWASRLGNCRLSQLTRGKVAVQYNALLAENLGTAARPRRRTVATANRYLSAFSQACKVAEREWRWLQDNPLRGIERKKERRRHSPGLSGQQLHALLTACAGSAARELGLIVLLALATGMRRTELLRLRWQDIDLRGGSIRIPAAEGRAQRSVPIAPQLLAPLGQHAQQQGRLATVVFAELGRQSGLDRAFRAAALSGGLRDLRFHDLRRIAVHYFAGRGKSPEDIAALLGYKSMAMLRFSVSPPEQGVVAYLKHILD